MAEPQVTFARLLRKLRIDARLTQEDLAEAASLSPRTISDLERGVHLTAQKETARLLADALHLTGVASAEFMAVARTRTPRRIRTSSAPAATWTAPGHPSPDEGRLEMVTTLCPRCGQRNPTQVRFCVHCGVQLEIECAACGTRQPPEARFCSVCGQAAAPTAVPAGRVPRRISEKVQAVRLPIEGERKRVSVLFCGVAPLAAHDEELGPEESHLFISRFFRMALREVHRYEGTINQFFGTGFMALFGAPIAHEDHARRAILAALGVTARAETKVSIGINSGLVIVGTIGDDLRVDYIASGDTTVLAYRLNTAAAPGAVLVSQATARLVSGYFQMEQLSPAQIEGQMVYPLRVLGLGTRTEQIVPGQELSPFTGRNQELAGLHRALEAVTGSSGQVVGLTGDPGLGKSRLVWEFCRAVQDDVTLLEGRCPSYGSNIPYLLLRELVRSACGIAVDDSLDQVARKTELTVKTFGLDVSLAHNLLHIFSETTGEQELAGLDPQAIRARTFHALSQLLITQAAHRPLVLLVEDLQWIDRTSEGFLAEFTDELPSVPVMLLGTYRPDYRPPWSGKSFTSQLALHPLSAADGEAIVAWVLGDDDGVAAIAARGEGNPFFLEELARAIRDQTTDKGEAIVPETVQQVLAARIDRLDADQKTALQLAAVLGREFSMELAAEAWDGSAPLEARLQELKRLEFLRERHGAPERTFVFEHALTCDVAYDSMLHARRRQLHGRASAALERSQASQRFEHCELLAYHYLRSTDPARAIPYLVAAGDQAREKYANQEAIAVYTQAMDLVEQSGLCQLPDSYVALCEGLGIVLVRLSRYDTAIDTYRKGLDIIHDLFQKAHFHVLCAEAEEGAHHYENALTQCDLAEQALGPISDKPDNRLLSSWFDIQHKRMNILYWLIDTERYGQLIEQVRPLVETYGSAKQRVDFLLGVRGWNLRKQRYLATAETLELARAAHAIAKADPTYSGWTGFNLGFTLIWHEDLEEATEMLQESLQEGKRRGDVALQSRSLTYLMVAARKRRDADVVKKATGPVIQQARNASLPEYEAMAIANRAWVAWRGGEEGRAAADARAALEMFKRLPVTYPFDWMALWPLLAMALTSQQIEQAVHYARGMLPPPQQLLREPACTLLDSAIRAWDSGLSARSECLLTRAVSAAIELGYL
jgi:class 3 adenylate cyclase/transcriptional regulator with XRE-family HTH domain/tetratricopeptide (TPR) repeat protein